MTFKPVGYRILVLQTERKNAETEGGLELVNNTLAEGTVVEVSELLKGLYKVGDTVYFPPTAGVEYPYKGKVHKILIGTEQPSGDVWGVEVNEITPEDKGDGL